jgi:D-inositol-3-phosphate glycosyltransferase
VKSPTDHQVIGPSSEPSPLKISILTGGSDPSYLYGLASGLMAQGFVLDVIGNDEQLQFPDLVNHSSFNFFNLRGDQRPDAPLFVKAKRIVAFYARLIRYAATARPEVFHILWNNKFEVFDRTMLTAYYRLLGKRVVLTVHNVNKAKRDRTDSMTNRLSLRIHYRLADHLFVHTAKMKEELVQDFGVRASAVTVIPFGVNNSVPCTLLTQAEARQRLGLPSAARVLLFYGRIKPYKGLDYLVEAFNQLLVRRDDYRLLVAGEPHDCDEYWAKLQDAMQPQIEQGRILLKVDYVPDNETEMYFKAADVSVLPYRDIYQSGVMFLAYNFGVPVVATDVGSLKDDVVEGQTGFVCGPDDASELARTLETYFESTLYKERAHARSAIRRITYERHSWDVVSAITGQVYRGLVGPSEPDSDRGPDGQSVHTLSKCQE